MVLDILENTSAALSFGIRRKAIATSFSSSSSNKRAMSTAFITSKILWAALKSPLIRSSVKMLAFITIHPFLEADRNSVS